MRRLLCLLVLATIAALGVAAPGAATPARGAAAAAVPDALRVGDGRRVVLRTTGVGAQVYDCVDGAWRFREPVATLGGAGRPLGIHFAGPTWQSLRDGSRVTGRLLASVPAPRAGRDIPWLLLEASANAGTGVFGEVGLVQRLRTRGGVAPAGSCDPATQASTAVPYRAAYVFWGPAAASAAGATPTVQARSSRYGRIVVDGRGLTLYAFTRDGRGRSRCYGACARAWPPLLVTGRPQAGRGIRGALLGTTRRRDGARQVTYRGRPLYRYVRERRPGEIFCQNVVGFGGTWLLVSPRGALIR